jgi:hypothetical protein
VTMSTYRSRARVFHVDLSTGPVPVSYTPSTSTSTTTPERG